MESILSIFNTSFIRKEKNVMLSEFICHFKYLAIFEIIWKVTNHESPVAKIYMNGATTVTQSWFFILST